MTDGNCFCNRAPVILEIRSNTMSTVHTVHIVAECNKIKRITIEMKETRIVHGFKTVQYDKQCNTVSMRWTLYMVQI